jgi:hypothetical protein
MKQISRREFLGKSTIGIGSAIIASQIPSDLMASEAMNAKIDGRHGIQVG